MIPLSNLDSNDTCHIHTKIIFGETIWAEGELSWHWDSFATRQLIDNFKKKKIIMGIILMLLPLNLRVAR